MNPTIDIPSHPGKLDPSFGDAGEVIFKPPVDGHFDPAYMALTPAGQSLICGTLVTQNNPLYACIALKPNGKVDTGFGDNGWVFGLYKNEPTPFFNSSHAENVAVLPDGKILLSGNCFFAENPLAYYGVARLNADGSLDKSFGKNGTVIVDQPGHSRKGRRPRFAPSASLTLSSTAGGRRMCVLADGRIVLLIEFESTLPIIYGLACLMPDGSLDKQFNDTGYAQIDNAGLEQVLYEGVIAAHDDTISVCGSGLGDGYYTAILNKFTGKGVLDKSFANNGVLLFPDSKPESDFLFMGMAVQPNKRLLVAGLNGEAQALLLSLEPDGKANIQFNRGQPLQARIDDAPSMWSWAMVSQPEARIFVVGATMDNYDFTLTRLLSDGKPDESFSNGKAALRYNVRNYKAVAPVQIQGNRVYFISRPNLYCGLLPGV
ncbi:delta-60 repeat domain-containing protein [Pseudomonas sp. NPDC096950]|uniref:delta-60 repeat domain-containing protein n=1 Tax=Pseudomonas sp. NPDC096950 TaxID=3364485 RepID=UPI00383B3B1B